MDGTILKIVETHKHLGVHLPSNNKWFLAYSLFIHSLFIMCSFLAYSLCALIPCLFLAYSLFICVLIPCLFLVYSLFIHCVLILAYALLVYSLPIV